MNSGTKKKKISKQVTTNGVDTYNETQNQTQDTPNNLLKQLADRSTFNGKSGYSNIREYRVYERLYDIHHRR